MFWKDLKEQNIENRGEKVELSKKIEIIDFNDKNYPEKLKDLVDPPKLLYLIGNKKLLNEFSIAIVGARKCEEETVKMAKQYSYDLASRNIVIVSGMAIGVDASAHRGALDVGGKTIAVLGSGFNNIYPKSNQKLFYEIIEKDGLIITEYSEDVPPFRYNFTARNRIISALSEGVIVMQATETSGSMKTAEYAISLNRKLFAVPGSVYDEKFSGCNKLLLRGANATLSSEDILTSFKDKKKFKKSLNIPKNKIDVPDEFKEIYNLIKETPKNVNQISKDLKILIPVLNSKLTAMEIERIHKRNARGIF